MFSAEFLITSLIVILIPGTGVIFTISTGLALGRRAGFYAASGCTLGIVPHLLATMLGLAAVMHTGALAFQLLRYAGVAYLFYLAIVTWRDRSAFAAGAVQRNVSMSGLLVRAFLLNILNPKLTIFFLAFLPHFIESGASSPLLQLIGLSVMFMLMTFVVFVIYGFLAHTLRKRVLESPSIQTWLRQGIAAIFAGLGVQLAVAGR